MAELEIELEKEKKEKVSISKSSSAFLKKPSILVPSAGLTLLSTYNVNKKAATVRKLYSII